MGMSQGYSIFEVTITLALTGILLGISVPSFNMLERLSLKEDAWKTVSMVTRAKNLALLRAADYYVLFQPLSVTIVTGKGRIVSSQKFRASLRVRGERTFKLPFSRNGVTSPTTIDLTLGGRACQVVITLRGRARSTC
jgi:Tfp pilus assembly protein FimT